MPGTRWDFLTSRRRTAYVLQILAAAAAPVAGYLIQDSAWWIVGSVVAAGGAVAVGEVRKRASEALAAEATAVEVQARIEARVAMVGALQPVATTLSGVVTSDEDSRQSMLGTVTQAVVVAAVRQVSAEDVRGAWYAHEVVDGRRVLQRTCSDGRNDTTEHTLFEEGTVEGDAALAMVDGDDHRYVVDIASEPPAGWDPERVRRYRTFVAVGISAKERPLGMLTVDALEPGSLTDEDLQTVILLASLLRIGLAADL